MNLLKQETREMGTDPQNDNTGKAAFQGRDNFIFHVYNQLLKQILSCTGMERAVLLLKQKQDLSIEAEAVKETNDRIKINSVYQLKSIRTPGSYLPISLINEVYQAGNKLLSIQPDKDKEVSTDPYLKQKKPGCIVCATIQSQDEFPGILYLESQTSIDIKSKDNQNLFKLCLEQASLSLENTQNYSHLQTQLADHLQELNTLKKNNEHENLARNRLLKGINQEIQNPLNSIMGFSQLLAKKGRQFRFPPEIRQYIRKIENSGVELAEMLNNLLEYTKPDPENQVASIEKIDIKLLLKGIILSQHIQAKEMEKDVKITLEGDLPKSIHSRRSVLARVLMILIENAVRRSRSGENILLKASYKDPWLTLAIEDEGPELSSDVKKILFNESAAIDLETGSPLNFISRELSLAGRMINQLNGKLEYQKRENKQSAFILQISDEKQTQPTRVQVKSSLIDVSESKENNSQKPVKSNSATLINSRDLIRESKNNQLALELKALNSIPIFKGRTLISKIRKLKQTCKPTNREYLKALDNLEKSVYDGNAGRFNSIINHLLNQSIY